MLYKHDMVFWYDCIIWSFIQVVYITRENVLSWRQDAAESGEWCTATTTEPPTSARCHACIAMVVGQSPRAPSMINHLQHYYPVGVNFWCYQNKMHFKSEKQSSKNHYMIIRNYWSMKQMYYSHIFTGWLLTSRRTFVFSLNEMTRPVIFVNFMILFRNYSHLL